MDQDQDQGPTLRNLLGSSCTVFGLGLSAAGVFFPEQRSGLLMFGLFLVVGGVLLLFLEERSPRSAAPPDALPRLPLRYFLGEGFLVLLGGWFVGGWLFTLCEDLVDGLQAGATGSSSGLIALKWGAFIILSPLIFSVLFEKQRTPGLWALWRRGFILLLFGCLPFLPAFFLWQGSQLMEHFGVIGKGFSDEVGLGLTLWGMNIFFLPLSMLRRARLTARSGSKNPLAEHDRRGSGVQQEARP